MKALGLLIASTILLAILFQCGPAATPEPPSVEAPTEVPEPSPEQATAPPSEEAATPGPSTPWPSAEPTQPPPTATPTSIPPTFTPTTPPPSATSTIATMEAKVINVVDGDTIVVEFGGQAYRVRYIGINTPETDQPGGAEATEINRQLVAGQIVELVKDVSETDRYGRLLRYVYVGGLFVNAELVRLGYAQAATYPPDVAYADFFVQLEEEARGAGRGLWAIAPSPTSETPAWNCSGNIFNCSDFSSCAQVMSYWNACPGDPSRLDGDHDGIPCESLCP